jgi:hypothetical protein
MGFVVSRLNVSITGLEGAMGGHYVPAVPEVLITLMLVAVGFTAFALAVKYLPVYHEEEEVPAVADRAGAPSALVAAAVKT